jgi:hypothetical protein
MTEIENRSESCVAQNAATRSENTANSLLAHRRQRVTGQTMLFSRIFYL